MAANRNPEHHTQTIMIPPHRLTPAEAKKVSDMAKLCLEEGRPMLLSSGWRVYSGPPWHIDAPSMPSGPITVVDNGPQVPRWRMWSLSIAVFLATTVAFWVGFMMATP